MFLEISTPTEKYLMNGLVDMQEKLNDKTKEVEELKDLLAEIKNNEECNNTENTTSSIVPYNHYSRDDEDIFAFILGVEKDRIEITKVEKEIKIVVHANTNIIKNRTLTERFHLLYSQEDVEIATIEVTDKFEDEPTVYYNNGVLTVSFKTKEEIKPKKINISIK